MKRMIISPAQLKAINEAATQILTGTSSNAQTVAQDALAKSPGQDVTVDITDATPGMEKKNGFAASTATTNPQQIKNFGKMTFGANNNGSVFEGTKRQVELGRMLEMRRTGKVYSKKQLNEMFFETQDNTAKLKEIIGGCNLFTIFQAADILAPDGEDRLKEAYMSGADLEMVLDELFSSADPDKQEEFLGALRS
jgi:hypothetical protein